MSNQPRPFGSRPFVRAKLTVIVMSRKFAELAQKMPEIQTCSSVEFGGEVLEGPRVISSGKSLDEIAASFDSIMAAAKERVDDPVVTVLYRAGNCYQCNDKDEVCTHWGHFPTINSSFALESVDDIKRIEESINKMPFRLA